MINMWMQPPFKSDGCTFSTGKASNHRLFLEPVMLVMLKRKRSKKKKNQKIVIDGAKFFLKCTFAESPVSANLILDPSGYALAAGHQHAARVHDVTALVCDAKGRRGSVYEGQCRGQRVQM